jgi:hypothetical protein
MTVDKWGEKIWRNSKGKRHRLDGPAVECENGHKEWYVEGKRHRTDGPAIEWANGNKAWWVDGKLLGYDDKGFWALWDSLSNEDRANPTLLSYLPEKF